MKAVGTVETAFVFYHLRAAYISVMSMCLHNHTLHSAATPSGMRLHFSQTYAFAFNKCTALRHSALHLSASHDSASCIFVAVHFIGLQSSKLYTAKGQRQFSLHGF